MAIRKLYIVRLYKDWNGHFQIRSKPKHGYNAPSSGTKNDSREIRSYRLVEAAVVTSATKKRASVMGDRNARQYRDAQGVQRDR